MVQNVVALGIGKTGPLVDDLRLFSNTLRDTNNQFSEIAGAFSIRSFWESEKTPLPGNLLHRLVSYLLKI